MLLVSEDGNVCALSYHNAANIDTPLWDSHPLRTSESVPVQKEGHCSCDQLRISRCIILALVQFSHQGVSGSVHPRTAARQASLSITNSRSLLRLMSTESVMPSKHLILCRPLLLLPSIIPSIRVFSNESVLRIRFQLQLQFQLQYQSFQWIFRTDFL